MEGTANEPINASVALMERLGGETTLSVASCYQCKKCSCGCPLTFAMDYLPDQVIRLALLGQVDRLLRCRTIWVCSICETCTTRCPNGVNISGTMDWLKEEAHRQGVQAAEPEVYAFHPIFLENIRASGGRLREVKLLQKFTLARLLLRPDLKALKEEIQDQLNNAKVGLRLFRKGRLRLLPRLALKGKQEIEAIYEKYWQDHGK